MTNEEILHLASKDAVVKQYKFQVPHFSQEIWDALVESTKKYIMNLPPNDYFTLINLYK